MNEWCIYIALYCVLLYTHSALQSCGGGGVSTWVVYIVIYKMHLENVIFI